MKWYSLVALILFSSGLICAEEPPQLVKTQNLDRQWLADFFDKQFVTVSKHDDSVHIVSNRQLVGENIHGDRVTELNLRIGGSFYILDHHSTKKFTLKMITPEGITLAYHDEFDHRSFSVNKITQDDGTVEVFWRSVK
jgi:hypothetical protein